MDFQNIETTKKRDDFIDWLRGIAMLLVIFGHYVSGKLAIAIFAFHIPLFFFISGYLHKNNKTLLDRAGKSAKRMLLPYCFTVFIMLLIDVLIKLSPKDRIIAGLFVYPNANMENSILSINSGIGPVWFLPCCFFVILIASVVIQQCKTTNMLMICACILLLFGGILGLHILLPGCIDNALVLSFFYIIGYLVYKHIALFQKINTIIYGIAFVVAHIVFQCISVQSFASRVYPLFPINIFLSTIIVISFWRLMERFFSFFREKSIFNFLTTGIVAIGRKSLFILCVHTLEFCYIRDYIRGMDIIGNGLLNKVVIGTVICAIYIAGFCLYATIKAKAGIKHQSL